MHDERHRALINVDHRRLVRAAVRLLGPSDAEDAVQDAYLRALEADTQVFNSTQAWLLAVVRNLAIDRLRRRRWMDQWLVEMHPGDSLLASPSADMDAAHAQEASRALQLLAARLTPADGATVLLHEVFEVGHAELARASGRSEAGSRQQLRRALLRLRQAGAVPTPRRDTDNESGDETVLLRYLQSLQLRDPQMLWAMLRQPPISAAAGMSTVAARDTQAPHATVCGVIQVGGQLGLVLTLDGVRLCVLPLGVQPERDREPSLLE